MNKKTTKRKLQAQKTKKAIYESASMLFWEKGFDNVTVEEIATAAGVSVGAFYHHFKSKQEVMTVFYEKLDEKYEEYYEEIKKTKGTEVVSAVKELELFLVHVLSLIEIQGIECLRIVYPYMLTNMDFGDSMIDKNRPYFRITRELIENCKNKGEIDKSLDSDQAVSDITILCRGCAIDWCIQRGQKSIHEISLSLLGKYLAGISRINC